MLEPNKIVAARGLLGWKQKDLSTFSKVSVSTIKLVESGKQRASEDVAKSFLQAFQLNGVTITKNGVEEIGSTTTLHGSEGFETFLDDVYYTAIRVGTSETPCQVFLSNVVHSNWVKWMGDDKWKNHTTRMTQDKDLMDVRILTKEGDWNFPAAAYSKYKWLKEERFTPLAFYSYHDKLAFINFDNDNVVITVITQLETAINYRNHFLDTWDFAAIEPSKDNHG